MSSSPAAGVAPQAQTRAYKLASATHQNREYQEGTLLVSEAGSDMELRQWSGKKKKRVETVIARFRLEPNVEVTVDGAILRVSELSVTLESPAAAQEVAEILRRPARELERLVSDAEASARGLLEAREEALNLLSRVKVDPRGALFPAGSASTAAEGDPLDAFYSTFSTRLADSLEKMRSSFAEAEKRLGSSFTERLYAIAYTVGAVQNALFEGDSDLVREVAALQELGIATTAQELRADRPTARLVLRTHLALLAIATSRPVPS